MQSFSSMPIVYEKNAFSTPFLSGYKTLKIPIVNANGDPAWPELFPISRIDQLRQMVGIRHFSSQMLLEFIPPERTRLDPGGLHFYDEEFDSRTAKIGLNLITGQTLYWDPSTGRRNRDSSACVLLYRDDKNRRVFIHDILYLTVSDQEQFPLSRQSDLVLDFMSSRNLHRISIETNGIGGGLPEIIHDTAARRGYALQVIRIQNSRSKSDRILGAIEPLLSTGRLYAHHRVRSTPFLAEMLGWSPIGGGGIHDDGLDAVAGAITQSPTPVHGTATTPRTYSANTEFKI